MLAPDQISNSSSWSFLLKPDRILPKTQSISQMQTVSPQQVLRCSCYQNICMGNTILPVAG
ncbi:hypothetical protein EG68_03213 [Paragonimus skrjabini miyazakii]|uniref:Uncharacterized protein n=1 Tax=Paragonimus skrjabini miyazakii TaxID=59628 RepID=A0A8S9YYW6_9TREM|nr:hypothetical protein EG68_03213 [Paragonimus skrjabini miyazakii]